MHVLSVLCGALLCAHVIIIHRGASTLAVCSASCISHRRVWYRALSFHYARIRRSAIILTCKLPLCQIVSVASSVAAWATPRRQIGYSINHSVTPPAYLMRREPKLSLRKSRHDALKGFMYTDRGQAAPRQCWPLSYSQRPACIGGNC